MPEPAPRRTARRPATRSYAYIYNNDKRSTWWIQVNYSGKNYIPWAWLNLDGGDDMQRPADVLMEPHRDASPTPSTRPLDATVQGFAQLAAQLADRIGTVVLGKPRGGAAGADRAVRRRGTCCSRTCPGSARPRWPGRWRRRVHGQWRRIQFTPDLLPSDVSGVTIFNQASRGFEFHPGPVFANIVIADEINRASPKTQSALLEVMEERHGHRRRRAAPGAAAVPGGGHPEPGRDGRHLPAARGAARPVPGEARRSATRRGGRDRGAARRGARARPDALEPVTDTASVGEMVADGAAGAHRRPAATRTRCGWPPRPATHPQVRVGVSPRGVIALTRAACAFALIDGRGYVLPEDLKTLVEPVFAHRLLLSPDAQLRGVTAGRGAARGRRSVPVPLPVGPARRRGVTEWRAAMTDHRPRHRPARRRPRCCSAPASRSGTPIWPCSAPPPLVAVGWSRLASAALAARGSASTGVADPDRVTRGEPARMTLTVRNTSRLRAATPGRPRPVRADAGAGAAAAAAARPGHHRRLSGADQPARRRRRSGRCGSSGGDPLGLVTLARTYGGDTPGLGAPADPPAAGRAGRDGAQPGRAGRQGAARHDHVRLAARVRGRRRAAAGALAQHGQGRRADGARAARHQPAPDRGAARRPGGRATPDARRGRRAFEAACEAAASIVLAARREDLPMALLLVSGATTAGGRRITPPRRTWTAHRGHPARDERPRRGRCGGCGRAARRHPGLPHRAGRAADLGAVGALRGAYPRRGRRAVRRPTARPRSAGDGLIVIEAADGAEFAAAWDGVRGVVRRLLRAAGRAAGAGRDDRARRCWCSAGSTPVRCCRGWWPAPRSARSASASRPGGCRPGRWPRCRCWCWPAYTAARAVAPAPARRGRRAAARRSPGRAGQRHPPAAHRDDPGRAAAGHGAGAGGRGLAGRARRRPRSACGPGGCCSACAAHRRALRRRALPGRPERRRGRAGRPLGFAGAAPRSRSRPAPRPAADRRRRTLTPAPAAPRCGYGSAAGAAAGLAVVLGAGRGARPGGRPRRVDDTPVDPRRYVQPPQVDSLDESPLIRISGWALNPGPAAASTPCRTPGRRGAAGRSAVGWRC